MSGSGSSPALATCKKSQALLAGVPGGFSLCPPTDWPSNNLERDVNLNEEKKKKNTFHFFLCLFPNIVIYGCSSWQASKQKQSVLTDLHFPLVCFYEEFSIFQRYQQTRPVMALQF